MNLNVEKLLNGDIDETYNDKVFWYASEVIIKDNEIEIYVKNDNLVTFDNIDLKIKKISDFTGSTQSDLNHMKDVLVSSGSFLFINDKLVVTQRELTTQFDPGFWTTPAGRCDRSILDTGIKETIEEIKIQKNNKIFYPDIAKKFLNVKENIAFYKTSFYNEKKLFKMFNVKLFLDNIEIETCKSWMYFSSEVNTIEFRVLIFTELNKEGLLFTNPEFGTETGLKTIEELQKLNTVPALRKLIEEINNGKEE